MQKIHVWDEKPACQKRVTSTASPDHGVLCCHPLTLLERAVNDLIEVPNYY